MKPDFGFRISDGVTEPWPEPKRIIPEVQAMVKEAYSDWMKASCVKMQQADSPWIVLSHQTRFAADLRGRFEA